MDNYEYEFNWPVGMIFWIIIILLSWDEAVKSVSFSSLALSLLSSFSFGVAADPLSSILMQDVTNSTALPSKGLRDSWTRYTWKLPSPKSLSSTCGVAYRMLENFPYP